MPNQKGFSKIAVIIIILILIGGVYFVFSKKGENIPDQNTENQNSQSSQSTGGDLSMSDWKTYRNEKYGFEIKYPPNFLFNESFNGNAIGVDFSLSFGPPRNEIYGSEDISPLEASNWYRLIIGTEPQRQGGEKIEESIISGEQAKTFKFRETFPDSADSGSNYYITYILHNGLLFEFIDDQEEGDIMTTYVKILSTLKFTK